MLLIEERKLVSVSEAVYSIDRIKNVLYPVFDKYSVRKATLFGSYAKGIADGKSDIDLLLDSGLRGLNFVELIESIHSAVDKDVDVFDISHIIPGSRIQDEINKYGVTIYEAFSP